MPFDPVRGVGYEPRQDNPAVLIKNETLTEAAPNTTTSTLEISDPIDVQFIQASITITQFVAGSTMDIRLLRNGLEVDRLDWGVTMDQIPTITGTNTSYSFFSQKIDTFHKGETLSLEATYDAGSGGNVTMVFIISLYGTWH